MATSITWLGHAAFRLDTPGGTRLYVDPWLTGNPSCPEREREPERVDLIAVTHGHGDHIGDTVALHQRFGCPVVAQVELRELAHVARRRGRRHGELASTRAARSPSAMSGSRSPTPTIPRAPTTAPISASRAGIVVRMDGGPTVYFAGDTNVFGDMALIARIYRPDVAVLPIGDHFTMGPDEAAVALELLGVGTLSSRPTTARSRCSQAHPTRCARSRRPASRSSPRHRGTRSSFDVRTVSAGSARPAGAFPRSRSKDRSTSTARSSSTRSTTCRGFARPTS